MTNFSNTTFYVGVTNDLIRRIYEHKHEMVEGFTKRYHLDKLVYYEIFDDFYSAISREKQLKGGSRQQKVDLIEKNNSEYIDLCKDIV